MATYSELVARFPLRPIHNKRTHRAALAMLNEMMGLGDDRMSRDEEDFARVLGLLLREYEQTQAHTKPLADISPRELLQFLMDENGLKQIDIARVIGYKSHVSAFLSGTRGLSASEARKLGEFFSMDPRAFLSLDRPAGTRRNSSAARMVAAGLLSSTNETVPETSKKTEKVRKRPKIREK
jgi:HTH-type transcriptional regulator / antitoxin HigA